MKPKLRRICDKRRAISLAGTLIITILALSVYASGEEKMKIMCPAFQEGGNIPSQFTCDAANISPELHISGAPSAAQSLVLIVDDPDAPGGLFTHWLVWNIEPKTNQIAEGGTAGKGIQGKNDFGKAGYGGPCPPSGRHRYFFKVLALDQKLDLAANAKRKELDAKMRGHVIAQGELMGRYARKQ